MRRKKLAAINLSRAVISEILVFAGDIVNNNGALRRSAAIATSVTQMVFTPIFLFPAIIG
jgi:hypothetical protein